MRGRQGQSEDTVLVVCVAAGVALVAVAVVLVVVLCQMYEDCRQKVSHD